LLACGDAVLELLIGGIALGAKRNLGLATRNQLIAVVKKEFMHLAVIPAWSFRLSGVGARVGLSQYQQVVDTTMSVERVAHVGRVVVHRAMFLPLSRQRPVPAEQASCLRETRRHAHAEVGRPCKSDRFLESRMIEKRVRKLFQTLALLATVGSCVGQVAWAREITVFEWHEPNGVTSYSQSAPPAGTGGVTSHAIDTRSFTPAQRAAVRANLASIDAGQQADSDRYRAQVAAADQTVAQALHSLTAAELAARTGRSPQAGDRVGNAGGGSRLRSDYFERQRMLEAAVQQARGRVEEAYRARSAITP
jgi:hypothetical protein